MEGKQKNLKQLFIPICLEILCQMLAGMADTLMLSSVGDKAVGAVGTANTYIGIFIIMFSIISSGMIAVMTQYIGAKKDGVAYQARQLGLVFNGIIGVLLAVLLFQTPLPVRFRCFPAQGFVYFPVCWFFPGVFFAVLSDGHWLSAVLHQPQAGIPVSSQMAPIRCFPDKSPPRHGRFGPQPLYGILPGTL